MATTAPWTVRTTKRKSTRNTPEPRKRHRASLPAEDQAGPRVRRQKQQTLTQIQWAPSRPVSFDEGEWEPLEVKIEPRSRHGRQIPALKKRDSTLTQINFLLGRPSIETNEQDLTPLLVPKQGDATVSQLDGSYDSPRKLRHSKTLGGRAGSHQKRKSTSVPADESQEYVPTTKRRKGKAEASEMPGQGHRRRSGRHANRLPSDPAENFAVLQEALADITPKAYTPAFEIKESTGFDEEVENTACFEEDRSSQAVAHPGPEVQDSVDEMEKDVEVLSVSPVKTVANTPQKERRYIPSSQSPESLPPSTRKNDAASRSTHNTTPKRYPLAEWPTNTPTRRPLAGADDFSMAKSTSKQKICTFKLPRISLGSMKKRVEDSQADIWAIQPTSSPKPKGGSQRHPEGVFHDKIIPEEQPEIPSTSQVQNDAALTSSPPQPAEAETQESLVSLSAIFGIKRNDTVDSNELQPKHASADSNVETRDFVTLSQRTPQKQIQCVRSLQSQSEHTGEADDFGSPLANDTQFAAHLARVPTSPLRMNDCVEQLNPHDTIRISNSSPSSEGAASSSPLPAPKLVDRVEYQNLTTTIPIKDLPSPGLPPMPPPTQRSIAPASLPHPSQISTQELSQQLPQLSSVPQRSPSRTERITIKDSSSMHQYLSQLSEYNEDELQLQRELESTHHGLLDEEDDDDGYDDLDPRSPRRTVRFERLCQQPDLMKEQDIGQDHSPSRPEEEDNAPDPSPPANFTQNGHVTTARIEDMRKRGLIPPGYNPPAYKVPSARELLPAWMFEDDHDEL